MPEKHNTLISQIHKEKNPGQVWWCMTGARGRTECEVSLVYTVRSRTTWTKQRDTVSNNQSIKQQPTHNPASLMHQLMVAVILAVCLISRVFGLTEVLLDTDQRIPG